MTLAGQEPPRVRALIEAGVTFAMSREPAPPDEAPAATPAEEQSPVTDGDGVHYSPFEEVCLSLLLALRQCVGCL